MGKENFMYRIAKAGISVMLVASLAFTSGAIIYADENNVDKNIVSENAETTQSVGPRVTSVYLDKNGQNVKRGETIHFAVGIYDTAEITNALIVLTCDHSGYSVILTHNEESGLYEGDFTIREDVPLSDLYIMYINVYDAEENYITDFGRQSEQYNYSETYYVNVCDDEGNFTPQDATVQFWVWDAAKQEYVKDEKITVPNRTAVNDIKNYYKPQTSPDGLNFENWVYFDIERRPYEHSVNGGNVVTYADLYAKYDKNIIIFGKGYEYKYPYEGFGDHNISYTYAKEGEIIELPEVEGIENAEWISYFFNSNDKLSANKYTVGKRFIQYCEVNESGEPKKIGDIKTKIAVDEIESISNSGENGEVTVNMETANVIPKEILEAAQGKDVDLVFDMGDCKWTVNGKDLTDENMADINIGVERSEEAEKDEVVEDIIGGRNSEKLVFNADGNLGLNLMLNLTRSDNVNSKKAVLIQKNSDAFELADSALLNDSSFNLNIQSGNEAYVVYGENGDSNGDGEVDIKDAIENLKEMSGSESLDEVKKGFADVNMDNKVDLKDLTTEIQYISGKIDSLY